MNSEKRDRLLPEKTEKSQKHQNKKSKAAGHVLEFLIFFGNNLRSATFLGGGRRFCVAVISDLQKRFLSQKMFWRERAISTK